MIAFPDQYPACRGSRSFESDDDIVARLDRFGEALLALSAEFDDIERGERQFSPRTVELACRAIPCIREARPELLRRNQ